MITYVDKHIITFVDEWGDLVLPQLKKVKYKDKTETFSKTRKCKMVLDSIAAGKKAYVVGFKNCRGMIRKWIFDEQGRMIRQQGKGVIEINPSVVTMSAVDINEPFISSDEILLAEYHRDKPYNLEREIVAEAMIEAGFNPDKDIIFIFFVRQEEIDFTVRRFIDEFRHIITKEYCRAKGILAIKDPKWVRYHASDKVTPYTNAFFFKGVQLTYTNREALKKERLGLY